jgi:hypothetical protein
MTVAKTSCEMTAMGRGSDIGARPTLLFAAIASVGRTRSEHRVGAASGTREAR